MWKRSGSAPSTEQNGARTRQQICQHLGLVLASLQAQKWQSFCCLWIAWSNVSGDRGLVWDMDPGERSLDYVSHCGHVGEMEKPGF